MTNICPAITADSIASALIAELTAECAHDAAAFASMIDELTPDDFADTMLSDCRDDDDFMNIFIPDPDDADRMIDSILDHLDSPLLYSRIRDMIITAIIRLRALCP